MVFLPNTLLGALLILVGAIRRVAVNTGLEPVAKVVVYLTPVAWRHLTRLKMPGRGFIVKRSPLELNGGYSIPVTALIKTPA